MGRTEHEGAAPCVDHHGWKGVTAEERGPAALLPELDGMERGHQHLLTAGPIELLAHDALDALQDPKAEGKEGVDARRESTDVPGPHEQPMTGYLGVSRRLP